MPGPLCLKFLGSVLTCFAWILPFCNFFCKFGNLVAGFLTMRLSFLAFTCSPFNQDVVLPTSWTVVGHYIPKLGGLRSPMPS